MRILYVTNGFPYPLTSGYLRHYHFIRELSARHSVTLLSVVGPKFEEAHLEGMEPYTERVMTFEPKRQNGNGRRSLLGKAVAAATGDERAHAMAETVARLLDREHFDAAVLSGKRTLPVLGPLLALPLVIDVCDVASARVLGQMRQLGPRALPVHGIKYLQERYTERTMARHANHLVFASRRDREAIAGTLATSSIIANGVDVDFWKRSGDRLGRDTIVFTGAMHYPPNHDAAMFLIRSILPRVRAKSPDVKALIVGRDPAPTLVEAAREAGVHVTGFVEDVRPYLEQASVFAAPLRFSSGIQNKLLEAMAFALPVVTTQTGASGVNAGKEPAPIDVADDPNVFAERVLEHLAAAEADPTPHLAARRFAKRNFSWRYGAHCLEEALESVVAVGARSTGVDRSAVAGIDNIETRTAGGEHGPHEDGTTQARPWSPVR